VVHIGGTRHSCSRREPAIEGPRQHKRRKVYWWCGGESASPCPQIKSSSVAFIEERERVQGRGQGPTGGDPCSEKGRVRGREQGPKGGDPCLEKGRGRGRERGLKGGDPCSVKGRGRGLERGLRGGDPCSVKGRGQGRERGLRGGDPCLVKGRGQGQGPGRSGGAFFRWTVRGQERVRELGLRWREQASPVGQSKLEGAPPFWRGRSAGTGK